MLKPWDGRSRITCQNSIKRWPPVHQSSIYVLSLLTFATHSMDNQTLPILDASTVLAFLQTDESETNSEVTLPSLDELFNAHIAEQTPTDETSSPPPLSSNSTPITTKTQRGGPKLVLDGYTYSKKRDLKNSRDWICTKKACHGSLKTHLDSFEAIRSRPHTCKPLSQEECNLLTSEIDIVFDSSHTSTKELAALLHHPYSKNLSRRRWRKSRTSSTSSN